MRLGTLTSSQNVGAKRGCEQFFLEDRGLPSIASGFPQLAPEKVP